MIIHFAAADDEVGLLIKAMTLSQFSHCAIEIDGQIWEATFKKGVSVCDKADFRSRYPESETIEVFGDDEAALTFLDAQLGTGYDFAALFTLALRENWQCPEKWFCSELVAAALVAAGSLKIDHDISRITPRDIWLSYKMRWR